MQTITATDGNTHFTRKSTARWTHAVITAYANGYVHVNWAKSVEAAQELVAHKHGHIASLTAVDKAADPAHPLSSVMVETTTAP